MLHQILNIYLHLLRLGVQLLVLFLDNQKFESYFDAHRRVGKEFFSFEWRVRL